MAIIWKDGRFGFERAEVGAFTLIVGWGTTRGDNFVAEVSPLGIRVKGMPDMATAKARAERELSKVLCAALDALGGKETP